MRTTVLAMVIALSGCATTAEPIYWDFDSGSVTSAYLDRQMRNGSFDVYQCPSSEADGRLEVAANGESRSIGFCALRSRQHSNARLNLTDGRKQICLWRETGSCTDDGFCESFSIADDCIDLETES